MRYSPIQAEVYKKNRAKLYAKLPPKSIVLVASNDIMPTNADGTMGFVQNSELFYLSGLDQEESYILLYPDAPEQQYKEIAFVRETSELIAIWEGKKFTKKEVTEISGIQNVQWNTSLDQFLKTLIYTTEHVFVLENEHIRNSSEVETQNDRFIKSLKNQFLTIDFKRLAPFTNEIRMVKEKEEIDQIQKAIDITESGFRRILNFTKPGVLEYEIEAEFIHEFIKSASGGFAYTPIIASGANSCVLHYIENENICKDGDLLLLDVGAKYGNYNADMTRTIPVNGKFSPRQKQVYQAVLDVLKYATSILKPGIFWVDYQREVEQFMESKLIDLGLFTRDDVANQNPSSPLFKKYFMHGVAHHLGIDVHDVWNKYLPIQEGMVLTCEPGIYIREEGLGIRLENNLLVTKDGNINLMQHIPIEIEEIESLMSK